MDRQKATCLVVDRNPGVLALDRPPQEPILQLEDSPLDKLGAGLPEGSLSVTRPLQQPPPLLQLSQPLAVSVLVLPAPQGAPTCQPEDSALASLPAPLRVPTLQPEDSASARLPAPLPPAPPPNLRLLLPLALPLAVVEQRHPGVSLPVGSALERRQQLQPCLKRRQEHFAFQLPEERRPPQLAG